MAVKLNEIIYVAYLEEYLTHKCSVNITTFARHSGTLFYTHCMSQSHIIL